MNRSEADILVRRVTLEEIIPLRHEVLRAGLPRDSAIFPGDELATSRHYGAFSVDQAAAAIGCATFHFNHYESEPAWQLRGMAVDARFRGYGVGRKLLELADRQILADPAPTRLCWCNARVPAVGFYELLGWKVVSEVFDIPTAGPHVKMMRRI